MPEAEQELTIEEKIVIVDSWIESLGNYDEDRNVEAEIVRFLDSLI